MTSNKIIKKIEQLSLNDKKDDILDNKQIKIKNKGTGAGGSNTTLFGGKFEKDTSMFDNLIKSGFSETKINKTKYGFYLEKIISDKSIIYLTQGGLKLYLKKFFDIDIFRNPDEAYIIKTKKKNIIKILEKKEQNVEGSVETKLWSGPSLKREYEIVIGNNFVIEYAYCINDFLSNKINSNEKKYIILKQILDENKINILHANNSNYFDKLEEWINN